MSEYEIHQFLLSLLTN